MKKRALIILLILILITISIGCTRKEDNGITLIEGNRGIGESDDSYISEHQQMTQNELKEILLEATLVELKNIDNELIGGIDDREKINSFIETIFSFKIQDTFPHQEEKSIVGPINFFLNNHEGYFGLVKENYIFIEGYYFLMDQQEYARFLNLFKSNIIQQPVGDEG